MSTEYRSDIRLGEEYRDTVTGVVGTATSLHFFRNACERVVLTYLNKGLVQDASFDAVDLTHVATEEPAKAEKPGGPERALGERRVVTR